MSFKPLAFGLWTLASAGIIVLVAAVAYLISQFDRADVTEGTYLGLAIGDSKQASYEKVSGALRELNSSDPRVFIEIEVDQAASQVIGMDVGRHAMVQSSLAPSAFERFEGADQWKFYVSASYMNSLTLEFCDERLCRISRMKKPFELP